MAIVLELNVLVYKAVESQTFGHVVYMGSMNGIQVHCAHLQNLEYYFGRVDFPELKLLLPVKGRTFQHESIVFY